MGILRQQHHPEGVPIQPGHGVKGAALTGLLVIPRHEIGQRPLIFRPGWVDQHPRGLVHRQEPVILIQDGKRAVLRRVFRGFLLQGNGDHIPGFHGVIRPLWHSVDPDGIAPLELIYQPPGHTKLPQQKRRQPPLPPGGNFQLHTHTPLTCCSHKLLFTLRSQISCHCETRPKAGRGNPPV